MVTDYQVRKLWDALAAGRPLYKAAMRSSMTEKTARKYRDSAQLPTEMAPARSWTTRQDPFEGVWPEVYEQLTLHPQLEAKVLFEWLKEKHPGRFQDSQLRTLQRGVKRWRATEGPAKEVFFNQVHHPGRLCASDFTHMSDLEVTIGQQPFDHLVYHLVLTFSNWETVTICFSESFESFSEGLQNALGQLGGVPQRHRSDRMSLAVNNASQKKEFTRRYQALLQHYGLEAEKIQPRKAHENGDVESSHRWFKQAVDQTLMLRGSRDFESRQAYADFLEQLCQRRNMSRQQRLEQELAELRPLPPARQESFRRVGVQVNSGSLIRVQKNTYSVNSRLIGERVEVRIHVEHLEVWYGQKLVDQMPRLRGQGKHQINYRHVIDWLVRKPGAFENYRYREDLFPTTRFRMAYDLLCQTGPARAVRQYLQILCLAAKESQSAVDDALRVLLLGDEPLTYEAVRQHVLRDQEVPAVTAVTVEEAVLSVFDELLTNMEDCDDYPDGCQDSVERLFKGPPAADLS